MTTEPVALVDQLQPDAIRARLVERDRQARALRVLPRAAVARERRMAEASTPPQRPTAGLSSAE